MEATCGAQPREAGQRWRDAQNAEPHRDVAVLGSGRDIRSGGVKTDVVDRGAVRWQAAHLRSGERAESAPRTRPAPRPCSRGGRASFPCVSYSTTAPRRVPTATRRPQRPTAVATSAARSCGASPATREYTSCGSCNKRARRFSDGQRKLRARCAPPLLPPPPPRPAAPPPPTGRPRRPRQTARSRTPPCPGARFRLPAQSSVP